MSKMSSADEGGKGISSEVRVVTEKDLEEDTAARRVSGQSSKVSY